MENLSVPSYRPVRKETHSLAYHWPIGSSFYPELKKPDHQLKTAFLFSGQGSQYPGMGKELYRNNTTFRNAFDDCNRVVQDHAGFSLTDMFFEKDRENIAHSQLALFAVEYALAKVWLSQGVKPTVLLGHSAGEYVAGCVSGVFTFTDALRLIITREQLLSSLPEPGKMAIVFAEETEVEKLVQTYPGKADIAAVNSQINTVISGNALEINLLIKQLHNMKIHTQDLVATYAYHSPLLDKIQDKLYEFAKTIVYSPTKIAVISTLTGKLMHPGSQMDARYWCDQVRQKVQFSAAIKTLEDMGYDVLLEVGPSPALLAMAYNAFHPAGIRLPSLRKGRSDKQQMRESYAKICDIRITRQELEIARRLNLG